MQAPDPTDYGIALTDDGHPDFDNADYDAFNPDRSIGVRSSYFGNTTAVHLTDAVRRLNENALSAEIVKVAHIASLRASYAGYEKCAYYAALKGERLHPETARNFASAQDIEDARREAFTRAR